MKAKIVIIGGGINGLVAANYLRRAGFEVALLEKKPVLGGACSSRSLSIGHRRYAYAAGASVLGLMQDFVFEETGLGRRLALHLPTHPPIVYFPSRPSPCLLPLDARRLQRELREGWGERGRVEAFFLDLEKVRRYLIRGYRSARVPSMEEAEKELGGALARRWISGSARGLLNHYFTSEEMKVYESMAVTESGPVPLDSAYSAFNIPLMSSGSVFGGRWGFVKGGLWTLVRALGEINADLGVKVMTSAEALRVCEKTREVEYVRLGRTMRAHWDYLIFATDPLSAARLTGRRELVKSVSAKKFLGTSGKLVLIFKNPVRWKDQTGLPDFDSAFRFIMASETLAEFERSTRAVEGGRTPFSPGFYEIYCEGAAMRKLGCGNSHDIVSVFFKNLAFDKKGRDLAKVKELAQAAVLAKTENPEDLIGSVLLTPRDLKELFSLPQGNIDHTQLCSGQTFFSRNFSPDPRGNFYQFGKNERILYCGAGAYPCGSIAGTPGYMCARQLIGAGGYSAA